MNRVMVLASAVLAAGTVLRSLLDSNVVPALLLRAVFNNDVVPALSL